jgi:hypothetical protein
MRLVHYSQYICSEISYLNHFLDEYWIVEELHEVEGKCY